jgi:hypothetical protein
MWSNNNKVCGGIAKLKKICWQHGDGEMDINGVCLLWI